MRFSLENKQVNRIKIKGYPYWYRWNSYKDKKYRFKIRRRWRKRFKAKTFLYVTAKARNTFAVIANSRGRTIFQSSIGRVKKFKGRWKWQVPSIRFFGRKIASKLRYYRRKRVHLVLYPFPYSKTHTVFLTGLRQGRTRRAIRVITKKTSKPHGFRRLPKKRKT